MNGVIIVDKEAGYTSRDVVNVIGKSLGTKKVGHTGTLDPIATGVLVVCVGKALKISELLVSYDKEYEASVIIGYETDTLDVTGVKERENMIPINRDMVENVLQQFKGNIQQQVPKYAAVKVNGKKLYEYARNHEDVELPIREVEIKELELISDVTFVEGYYEFNIRCVVSKGTYIRSLIRDIGYALGSYGTMKELNRTRQGKFSIDQAISIEDIRKGNITMLSIPDVLDYPVISVSGELLKKISNGMTVPAFFQEDRAIIEDEEHQIIGIYQNIGRYATVFKMLK